MYPQAEGRMRYAAAPVDPASHLQQSWQVYPQTQQYVPQAMPQHYTQQGGMAGAQQGYQLQAHVNQAPFQMQQQPAQPIAGAGFGTQHVNTSAYPGAGYGCGQQQHAPFQGQQVMPANVHRHPDGTPPHHLQPSGVAAAAGATLYGYPTGTQMYAQSNTYQGTGEHISSHQQAPLTQGGFGAGQGQMAAYTSDDMIEDDYEPELEQQLYEASHARTVPQQARAAPEMQSIWATQQGQQGLTAQDAASGRLRAVSELPAPFHQLYAGRFKYFNPVQSECFDVAYGSSAHLVVAAPTGSGKTGVMELGILSLLKAYVDPATGQMGATGGATKAVYLAPLRALVQEKYKEWHDRFALLGLSTVELTGDSDPDPKTLELADIICTTPEKLDACTRKLNEGGSASFFGDIGLVLIDEVHLLGEAGRGPALEAGVVSRIKMVSRWPEMQQHAIASVRFIAVSATIPNIRDIAEWLGAVPPEGLRVYGEEMRPCKLRTIVRSYAACTNDFLFERKLNQYVGQIVQEFSAHKPTLVFCSSRKGTIETATHLKNEAESRAPRNGLGSCYVRDQAHLARIRAATAKTVHKGLAALLLAGIGFHNAGMEAADREVVESLFLAQDLPVLCTTSTLAQGVNLPAHLVIIKGTRRYCGAGGDAGAADSSYREYDRSVCLQMVGRAGRPQFDTEGTAVIMTQRETAVRYQNLLNGAEVVESGLKDCFPEHLLAEVVLGTIKDVGQAIEWLRTTFLYIRMKRDPQTYGIPASVNGAASSDAARVTAVETYLREQLVLGNVRTLVQHGLVSTDDHMLALRPAEPGRIMAHSYIALRTMVHIVEAPRFGGVPQLLSSVAKAAELSNIMLRRGEKRILNEMNLAPMDKGGPKHPLPGEGRKARKERVGSPLEKIFLLLNEALGDVPFEAVQKDFSLRGEQDQVLRVAERVMGAMSKYYLHTGAFAAACNSLQLVKSLRLRMWSDTAQQCRQLPNIGRLTASRLVEGGIGGLRALAGADARRIEAVAQRAYPFGTQLKLELQRHLPPNITVRLLSVISSHGGTKLQAELELRREDKPGGSGTGDKAGDRTQARLLVGNSLNDQVVMQTRIVLETFPSPYQFKVTIDAPGHNTQQGQGGQKQGPPRLVTAIILERCVGLDVVESLPLSRNTAGAGSTYTAGAGPEVVTLHEDEGTQQPGAATQGAGIEQPQAGEGAAAAPGHARGTLEWWLEQSKGGQQGGAGTKVTQARKRSASQDANPSGSKRAATGKAGDAGGGGAAAGTASKASIKNAKAAAPVQGFLQSGQVHTASMLPPAQTSAFTSGGGSTGLFAAVGGGLPPPPGQGFVAKLATYAAGFGRVSNSNTVGVAPAPVAAMSAGNVSGKDGTLTAAAPVPQVTASVHAVPHGPALSDQAVPPVSKAASSLASSEPDAHDAVDSRERAGQQANSTGLQAAAAANLDPSPNTQQIGGLGAAGRLKQSAPGLYGVAHKAGEACDEHSDDYDDEEEDASGSPPPVFQFAPKPTALPPRPPLHNINLALAALAPLRSIQAQPIASKGAQAVGPASSTPLLRDPTALGLTASKGLPSSAVVAPVHGGAATGTMLPGSGPLGLKVSSNGAAFVVKEPKSNGPSPALSPDVGAGRALLLNKLLGGTAQGRKQLMELDALAARRQQSQSQQPEQQQRLDDPTVQLGTSATQQQGGSRGGPAAAGGSASGSRWSDHMPGEQARVGLSHRAGSGALPLPPSAWGLSGSLHGSLLSAAQQALGSAPALKPAAKPLPADIRTSTSQGRGTNSTSRVKGQEEGKTDAAPGSHVPANKQSMPARSLAAQEDADQAPGPEDQRMRPAQTQAPPPPAAAAPFARAGGGHLTTTAHEEEDDDDDPFTQLLATQGSRLPPVHRVTGPSAPAARPTAQADLQALSSAGPSQAVPAAAASQQVTSVFDLFA